MRKKAILENFKKAVEISPVSPLEVAWSIGVEREKLEFILSGELPPTEMQEAEMVRFTFKSGVIMKDKDLIELMAKARSLAKKYYRLRADDPEEKSTLIECKQVEAQVDKELTARGFDVSGK